MKSRPRALDSDGYPIWMCDKIGYGYLYYFDFLDSSEESVGTPFGRVLWFDHFTSDDSSRDSPSETSSDSLSDALSDSSSVPSIPHSSDAITERPSHSSYVGPSRKRSRSPTTSVPVSSPIPRALSSVRADLLPPPKRIRSSDSVTDQEVSSDKISESFVLRETSLRDDIDVGGSDKLYSEPDIDLEIQAEIDKCIAYANALRAEGIDARVVVETVAREEVKTSARGTIGVRVDRVTHLVVSNDIPEPAQEERAIDGTYETLGDLVQRFHDHTVEIPVHRVQVIDSIQRDQGHRIVATGQQSAVLLERISELERDNIRLKGTTMPNTQSGVIMTREAVNELINCRVAEALETRDVSRNLKPLVEGGGEQEDINEGWNGNGNDNGNRGGNGNGNGRGNGYGNHNMNPGGYMPVALECTYQDFLKCQPLNFNGTEGVVGLTR
ncbi:hypothetical protein Tco_1347070 [Tanacetum coccineum]